MVDTIRETHEIPVQAETDVLVVGGGPAGIAASVAAARSGARVTLVERYGCLGGLATGGLVLHYMHVFDKGGRRWIGGIPYEILERLEARDAVRYEAPIKPHVDSELLKVVADEIVLESGVELLFHCWGARPLMEDGRATGAVLETKSGTRAILAGACIDTTGDGDMAAGAGAAFDMAHQKVGLPLKVGGIDQAAFEAFAEAEPDTLRDLEAELLSSGGFKLRARPTPYQDQGIHWVNTSGITSRRDGPPADDARAPLLDPTSPLDLTYAEVELRRRALASLEYYREHVPGFENAALLSFAWQLGVRTSRLIQGRATLTRGDVESGRTFEDAIGASAIWFGTTGHHQIPYGALVPETTRGLLVAGRCISADTWAINSARLIPPAMVTGQAAGTAAVMALDAGVLPDRIDVHALQARLRHDDVIIDQPA